MPKKLAHPAANPYRGTSKPALSDVEFDPELTSSYDECTWRTGSSEICWAWDGWETFCYTSFEKVGEDLEMTRTDGEVHVGGSDDLHALERQGKLDALLAA